MRSRFTRIVLVIVVLSSLSSGPQPAHAATEWTALVQQVLDGDTFVAYVLNEGTQRIRVTGIQAPESGWCNAKDATDRLKQLVEGKLVTLTARHASSKSQGRPLRYVSINGVDQGERLLREGYVFAVPHPVESSRNSRYLAASQTAQHRRVGPLWNSKRCGRGPSDTSPLVLVPKWDADGNDLANPNGEYVRIRNRSHRTVSLKGWTLRDGALDFYTFPSWAKIQPWRHVTVHVGRGRNTRDRFYWGYREGIFANNGDAAVLMDPHRDIRAAMMYPCRAYCADPLKGKIVIWQTTAGRSPNRQWVGIKNISRRNVNLDGYLFRTYPYGYDFGHRNGLSSTLRPGEIMRVYSGKGKESRLKRYLGKRHQPISTRSDRIEIRTFDDVSIACKAWGRWRC